MYRNPRDSRQHQQATHPSGAPVTRASIDPPGSDVMVKKIDRFWRSFNNAEEQAVVNVPRRERGRPDAPLVEFMWNGCRELPLGTTIPSLPAL
ncbi:hypothetical protein E2C01_068263 [Portunus trituberculatus]|uniref:Uncharacterized protein n=1 Tax=Portunus trituberculatus TaxID=210409 RepID=A0A5B7HNE8_PORTR|nr:hypothetical protein [Portunus trituberculatus]